MAQRPTTPAIGSVLNGKYCLESVLGEGVMGIVFRAVNTRLGQNVAIKIPQAIVLAEPALVDRFAREAKAAARLRHRNSARVIDVDTTEDGIPYLVMEFLQGHDLEAELLQRGKLGVDEAVGYVVQACSAMIEAHNRGIVHRDLKPSNLFLASEPDGSVCLKVLDFGISKFQSEKVKLTAPLAQIGTPLYMSPEQIRVSSALDERTDIWSLGVILYELLAGLPPFSGSSTSVGAAIVVDRPAPLSRYRDDLPAGLEAAIFHALEKEPSERFQTMREMLHALAPFSSQPVPSELPRASRTGVPPIASVPGVTFPSAIGGQGRVSAGLTDHSQQRRSARPMVLLVLGLALFGALPIGIYLGAHGSKAEASTVVPPRVLPSATAASTPSEQPSAEQSVQPRVTLDRNAAPDSSKPSTGTAPMENAAVARTPTRPRSYVAAPARPASGANAAASKQQAPSRAWDNDSPLPPQ